MRPIHNPSAGATTQHILQRSRVLLACALAAQLSWARAEQTPRAESAHVAAASFEPVALNISATLGQFDRDRDGLISRDEAKWMTPLHRGFSRLDANRDGSLDRRELANAMVVIER